MDGHSSLPMDEETSLVRGGQVIRSTAPSSSSSSQKTIIGSGWTRLCVVLAVVGLTSSVVYINRPTWMSSMTTKLEEELGDSGPRISSPANVPGMPKTIDDGKDKALPAKPPAATSDFGGNGFGFENVEEALEVGAVAVLPVTPKTTTTTTTTSPPEKSTIPAVVVSNKISTEVPTSSSAMIQEETPAGEEEEVTSSDALSSSSSSSSSATISSDNSDSSSPTTVVDTVAEDPLMTSSGLNGEPVMESISPVFVKADNALTPAAVQTPTIITEPTTTTTTTTSTTANVIPTIPTTIATATATIPTATTTIDTSSISLFSKVKGFFKGMMESISPVFVKADNALTPAAVQTPTIIAEPTTTTTTTTSTTTASVIPTTESLSPKITTTATTTTTATIATSSIVISKSAHTASETQSVKVGSDVKYSTMKSSANPRPNVVFILADDLGYNSLSEDISPWLWKMQEKGVKLENYYSQEACTPARASLLTGRIPLSIGLQYYEHSVDESGGLGLEETTLGEVFTAAGYETYMFGKWNLGNGSPRYLPTARGFSNFLGYMDGFNNYWSKNTPDIPEFRDFMYSNSQCYYMYDAADVTTYSTTLYQNKAVDAIKTHDYTKPLFMYMAFQAVHDPFSEAGKGGNDDFYPSPLCINQTFTHSPTFPTVA